METLLFLQAVGLICLCLVAEALVVVVMEQVAVLVVCFNKPFIWLQAHKQSQLVLVAQVNLQPITVMRLWEITAEALQLAHLLPQAVALV
jgi:hypothetical protein